MSDAFLVLAQTDAGPTCFLLPRFTPDGHLNAIRIQRLKDKLGDWSNASAEVEFQGALAWMVGDDGRGITTILEMVALTRLDCIIGSSGIMRQALVRALHYARHRSTFGTLLIDHPLMRNVLADLALESEAAVALSLRIARAVDASPRDAKERALARVATAIGKYFVCKRCTPFVNEAQECLGGNGYVEDSILARLYRQAPLNSIWEGSGNIQCLDVLRAFTREPETRAALTAELNETLGGNKYFDRAVASVLQELDNPQTVELRSRWITERIAMLLQASLLIRAGNTAVADTFCASRLGEGTHGIYYGTLSADAPFEQLIARAFNVVD